MEPVEGDERSGSSQLFVVFHHFLDILGTWGEIRSGFPAF
jgi:hypothetical protein